jgi:flagellar biosynthesis protein FliR
MLSINSAALQSWVVLLLWPMTRILAMMAVAPILNHRALTARVKISLALLITIVVIPTLPPPPPLDIFSWKGLLVLIQQTLIGFAIGFSMRIVFAAVELTGQVIGMTMGLGFAMFYDPQTQGQTNALGQFMVLLASLIFLSLDGHLIMISAVVESFATFPLSPEWQGGLDFMKMAGWGGKIFSAGLMMALPAVAALLITNMALGILTRAAPQLNLFGIGFPVTIFMGFIITALVLPGLLQPMLQLIQENITNMYF